MADSKISALPASTTPLAGIEVLPIVQSGVTKQVSVANLTAGRSVSVADLTVSTGNVIIGTSGKGIDFSVTSSGSGTMSSELLSDYEEGTWTPQVFFGGTEAGYINRSGSYTKIGRTVICQMNAYCFPGAGAMVIKNLPFAAGRLCVGLYGYVQADSPASSTPTNGLVGTGATECSTIYTCPGTTEVSPLLTIIYTV